MKTTAVTFLALASLALLAGGVLASQDTMKFKGHELASRAKVSIETARATAMNARPGVVTDQELEKESGGSGLRYSFDIRSGGKTYEVGVDAKSGRVLENKAEGRNPD